MSTVDGLQPIAAVLASKPGEPARIGGRVIDLRDPATPGDVFRLQVQDESGYLVITSYGTAPLGAWIHASGMWDGQRLEATALTVAQLSTHPFPRPAGEWSWAHQQRPGQLQRLRRRHEIMRSLRAFFDGQGFVEVETPLVVPSPGLELHLEALEVRGSGSGRWLITSPEYQMKRLLAAGMARLYQVCKCFRDAEEGTLHQPEFTMLEWYRAFAGVEDVMRDTETLVAHLARALYGKAEIARGGKPIDLTPPWQRLTVAEAFLRYAGVPLDQVPDDERFYRLLVERVEPELGHGRPTFLTEYPAHMASLARRAPHDPTVAERFEAYVCGIELCNGFGELTDPIEQRQRLLVDQRVRQASQRPVYPIDERFMSALEEGVPPSGGNALGVDRLVMLLLDAPEIQDVITVDARRL